MTSMGRFFLRVLVVMGFFVAAASPLHASGGAQDLELAWSYRAHGEGGTFRLYRALGTSELSLIAEFPAEAGSNRLHYSDPGTRHLPGLYELRYVPPTGREITLASARWEPSRFQPLPAPIQDHHQRTALPSRDAATIAQGAGTSFRLGVPFCRSLPARAPTVPPPEVSFARAIDLGS